MPYTFILLVFFMLRLPSAAPEKQKLPVPPGGTPLTDGLFLDETELANVHWLEYLHHLQQDSSRAKYRAALPDTSVWDAVDVTGYMKKNYLRAPSFRFHPVVGLSYEQVQQYCNWRSEVATAAFNQDNKRRRKYRLRDQDVVFRYRLPTAEEWEMAAAKGIGAKAATRTKKNDTALAYSIIDSLGYSRPDKQEALQAYLSQHPDTAVNCIKAFEKGLYYGLLAPEKVDENSGWGQKEVYPHIWGNVAEMTSRKGEAKGGSWAHRLKDITAGAIQTYNAPTAWLGVRCVSEVYLVPRGAP